MTYRCVNGHNKFFSLIMYNSSTGYGPSTRWQTLVFCSDERKFEQWEVKFLGYMLLRKLKDTMLYNPSPIQVTIPADGDNPARVETQEQDDTEKNAEAFAELIQFLDERSLALVMRDARDARDKGREAFKILRNHYTGSGKPRIITLFTQLTSLKKRSSESVTETAASSLKTIGEQVSDGLLISMILKGLPDDYKPFVVVV